ncbi:MAG TPA: 4-hydroxy-3-methylbut-2-enyl diphosphate reductase [Armatimonadota bacterium]|nr:4-hydroxy-3-methylbut-2-enyl diphosphate reductase [Armatimonadota bacterium]
MQVVISEHAGFCFGVRRAIELVTKAVESGGELSTLGPLIHNPQEVKRLESAGVKVTADITGARCKRIVMPSHGVAQEVYDLAKESCAEIIDATCPYVSKVHRTAKELAKAGFFVVVIGDPAHSEVKGILSAAGSGAIAVRSPEEAASFDWTDKAVGIVSQTTQTEERFQEIVDIIRKSAKEVRAVNTICIATRQRQEAVQDVAPEVDVMFVVGGRNSANTNRLREICESAGVPTYHIETASEIKNEWLEGKETAGITAGASTPDWLIEQVKDRLEKV